MVSSAGIPRVARAIVFGFVALVAVRIASAADGGDAPALSDKAAERPHPRSFKTFLPKPGESVDAPADELVQVLLDRQDKGDQESYMIQVLFRGKPAERGVRVLADRVEIDFYDTGKPAMRLAKIRGGIVEASSLDEFFYKDTAKESPARIKHLVRLTLFMREKPEFKFRDTLDRTLIHFTVPKAPQGPHP